MINRINSYYLRSYENSKEAIQHKNLTSLFHTTIAQIERTSTIIYYPLLAIINPAVPIFLLQFIMCPIGIATKTIALIVSKKNILSSFSTLQSSKTISSILGMPCIVLGIILNSAYTIKEIISIYQQTRLHITLKFKKEKTTENLIVTLQKLTTFSKNYQKGLFPEWLFEKIFNNTTPLQELINNLAEENCDIKKKQEAIEIVNLVQKYNRKKIFMHCLGILSGLIGISTFIVSICTGVIVIPIILSVLSFLFFGVQFAYNYYSIEKSPKTDEIKK